VRTLLLFGALAVAWLSADSARACSALPEPNLTIESVAPVDGASGFPRDGAIQIRLKLWPIDPNVGEAHPSVLTVRVSRVADGLEPPGTLDTFHRSWGIITWSPSEALRPNEQYRIEVSTGEQPHAGVEGATASITTFTTSDAFAPKLVLEGTLRASYRVGVAPLLEYGPCGMSTEVGKRPALFADVEMPTVRGGFDAYGYTAWLTLNDAAARVFDGPGEGKSPRASMVVDLMTQLTPQPGASNKATMEVPLEDKPYDACFGFNVWDPIGNSQSAQSICLSAAQAEAAFGRRDAGTETATDETSSDGGALAADAGKPEADHTSDDGGEIAADAGEEPASNPGRDTPRRVRSGCSVGQHGEPGHSAARVAALLILCVAWRRRRKRSA